MRDYNNPFSYLKDAFSGKIYKHNTWVVPNINKFYRKIKHLSHSNYVKHWGFASIMFSSNIISRLFFKDETSEITNVFKENFNRLDQDKVFAMMKLLIGSCLTHSLVDKVIKKELGKWKLTPEKFKEEVFSNLQFTREDEKVFEELNEKFRKGEKYYSSLYKKLFEKIGEAVKEDEKGIKLLGQYILFEYVYTTPPAIKSSIENRDF